MLPLLLVLYPLACGSYGPARVRVSCEQKLTHSKGLQPVTMLEVQHIEFQRRKHQIESSLPPATDEASLKLRKRILENLEMQVGRSPLSCFSTCCSVPSGTTRSPIHWLSSHIRL